jgi:hypothetical protein
MMITAEERPDLMISRYSAMAEFVRLSKKFVESLDC